ncbi:MAG: hypothetical protein GX155_02270 [Smithella sp.]|nr:hypothetical protein [Smithella sp.]
MSDMVCCVSSLRYGMACALVFIFICGCAWRFPTDTMQQPAGRLVAVAQIDLATEKGNYPLRAALIVQSPSWLRLELLPLIGPPDLYLAASPGRMSVFIPSRAEFYSGKPSAENLARFLPWAVSVEEMVAILSGECFVPEKGHLSCRYLEDENQAGGNTKPPSDGPAPAGRQAGLIRELIRYDEAQKEVYRVLFDDYRTGPAAPGRIVFRLTNGSACAILRYTDLKVESAGDMKVFELTAPDGATVIDLD